MAVDDDLAKFIILMMPWTDCLTSAPMGQFRLN